MQASGRRERPFQLTSGRSLHIEGTNLIRVEGNVMTGYTVHTGSNEKFSAGWDQIFSNGGKPAKPAKKEKQSKKAKAAAKAEAKAEKGAKKGDRKGKSGK